MQTASMSSVQFGSQELTKKKAKQLARDFRKNHAALYDVDSQNDFMVKPEAGKERTALYLQGAERIFPAIQRISNLIAKHVLPSIYSMDTHTPDDKEFANYKEFSDSHCVFGTPGWEKVPASVVPDPSERVVIGLDAEGLPDTGALAQLLFRKRKDGVAQIEIRKSENSVFEGNAKADEFFERLKEAGVQTFVVYGVATDICVKQFIDGAKERGFNVVVVSDAVHELAENGLENPEDPTYGDITALTSTQLESIVQAAKGRLPLFLKRIKI